MFLSYYKVFSIFFQAIPLADSLLKEKFFYRIKYILLYFVSVFLSLLLIAMLIRSRYIITERRLITQFGIIFSKYEIKKIRSVCLVSGTKKLNVYFDDFKSRFITIVVKEEWYYDFIKTLTSINEKIEFDFTDPENNDRKKKK